ncbi:uncharacterized protein LOC113300155 [Papaver somniferum]|uniref:uncharacterized protein LOC113300155 n=1 Tax=Papaver somniferum TaxID=3469 RepID=UPI000E6FAAFD|nr:uncharacterized protein LOC113300155 [Papaver somniferum]
MFRSAILGLLFTGSRNMYLLLQLGLLRFWRLRKPNQLFIRKKGKGLSASAVQSKWHTKKGPISDMKKGDSSCMCIYARESKRQYKELWETTNKTNILLSNINKLLLDPAILNASHKPRLRRRQEMPLTDAQE